jgi:hypothetical protein
MAAAENLVTNADVTKTRVALAGRNLSTPYLGSAAGTWDRYEKRYRGGGAGIASTRDVFQEQFETDAGTVQVAARHGEHLPIFGRSNAITPLPTAFVSRRFFRSNLRCFTRSLPNDAEMGLQGKP